MLVTSIFFFSHYAFNRSFPPVRQNWSLCGKGLKNAVEGGENYFGYQFSPSATMFSILSYTNTPFGR